MNDLGYVLGVLLGDGNLNQFGSHYTIRLKTTDESFALHFKSSLENITKKRVFFYHKERRRIWNQGSKTYDWNYREFTVDTHCKPWYLILKAMKEKVLNGLIINEDLVFIKALIKGFYDSEGCSNSKSIRLCNKNRALLELMQECLRRLNINCSGIYQQRTEHVLYIGSNSEKMKFHNIVGCKGK
ncbi:MAG: LAGLIDADG family homing endonuclease [Candidatus Methanomethylicaceae archaeon]|jgi:intein-encoded DNA endonuclease-like protein